jgi:hypothetical protein
MQNTYVAYFEHVTITYKVWHGLDQRGPVPSHHNIPFSHKNIQNHFIYDIPCLRFDLSRSVLGTLIFFCIPILIYCNIKIIYLRILKIKVNSDDHYHANADNRKQKHVI